jgi:hypothetical protein
MGHKVNECRKKTAATVKAKAQRAEAQQQKVSEN